MIDNTTDALNGLLKDPTDHRDLIFAAPPAIEVRRKVDLTVPKLGKPWEPAFNQLTSSSCGAHSAIEILIYVMMAFGRVPFVPSRMFIYWCTRMIMGTTGQDSGVYHRALLQALAKFGYPPEEMWPFDLSLMFTEPPKAVFEAAETNKITQYRSVPLDRNALMACLGGTTTHQPRPVIVGFSVFESYRSQETARTGRITEGGAQIGGHSMLLVSGDLDTDQTIVKQHYGESFGKDVKPGYGSTTFDYLLKNGSDFWTIYTPDEETPAA